MPIQSTIYSPNADSSEWKHRREGTQGKNKDVSQHAERQLLTHTVARQDPVYLIVQNAFPCSICHTWFRVTQSKYSVIIKVTANEGEYSRDHGLGGKPFLPHLIYYHGGAAKHVNMTSRGADANPPVGFPNHPAFDHF